MCKNKTIKPAEIVLRKVIRRMRRNEGGVNVIKKHGKHSTANL
jgi:hypothetical protein